MDSRRCERAVMLLHERLDDEAKPGDLAWLEEHLARCSPCREIEAQLTGLHKFALSGPLAEPPADFAATLANRWEARLTREAPKQSRLFTALQPYLALATFLVMLYAVPAGLIEAFTGTAPSAGAPLITQAGAVLERSISSVTGPIASRLNTALAGVFDTVGGTVPSTSGITGWLDGAPGLDEVGGTLLAWAGALQTQGLFLMFLFLTLATDLYLVRRPADTPVREGK